MNATPPADAAGVSGEVPGASTEDAAGDAAETEEAVAASNCMGAPPSSGSSSLDTAPESALSAATAHVSFRSSQTESADADAMPMGTKIDDATASSEVEHASPRAEVVGAEVSGPPTVPQAAGAPRVKRGAVPAPIKREPEASLDDAFDDLLGQLDFEEVVEVFADEEKVTAPPMPSGTPGAQPPPKPGRATSKKTREPCPICNEVFEKMPTNSPFCYDHKEMVEFACQQACQQDTPAKTQEAKDYFIHCREKDPVKFTELILDVERAAGPRGRGRKRKRLDWSQRLNVWSARKSAEDDTKGKWCDYIDWTVRV